MSSHEEIQSLLKEYRSGDDLPIKFTKRQVDFLAGALSGVATDAQRNIAWKLVVTKSA